MMRLSTLVRQPRSPYPSGLRWLDHASVCLTRSLTPGRTKFLGQSVRYSDNVGFLHSVREIFGERVYQFKAKTDAPHIIDAGANIGLSVLYFKSLYPKASIVAFEPDAAIHDMLTHNVAGLSDVELRQEAAWIEDTMLTFYTEGSLAGSSEVDFLGKGNTIQVRATRLREELRKRPVDFLKIDIEGAENSVLFDIADDLIQVDHLFFEYHSVPSMTQRLGEMLSLVQRAGFRYIINGAHGSALPFIERISHGFDLQLNVSCFRD